MKRNGPMVTRKVISIASLFAVLALAIGCATDQHGLSGQPAYNNKAKVSPSATKSGTVIVSAAASLEDVLAPIGKAFESAYPGERVRFNYGSSGTLLTQIEQGAPVDVFMSAGQQQMNQLLRDHRVLPAEETQLLTNTIVLITTAGSRTVAHGFSDLQSPQVRRIAIGTPSSVPAGLYAKETLSSIHLWSAIQPKLVFAKDVRQVLTYVEQGDVDAGMVYGTDAKSSPTVKVVATAPGSSHEPIVYPVAVIHNAIDPVGAKDFYRFLRTETSASIFKQYGFEVTKP